MKILKVLFWLLIVSSAAWAANNVEVHFNYPADTVFVGDTNRFEIWMENDDTIMGLSLPFVISGYTGYIMWDSTYGNHKPINIEDPQALTAFMDQLLHSLRGLYNGAFPDTIHLGGAAYPPNSYGLPTHTMRLVYSMQFYIPLGQPLETVCVDNAWVPPAGGWIYDFGLGSFPPDYFDCVNASTQNPDCPAVCFPMKIAPPQAKFGFAPLCGFAPLAVQFTDSSRNNPTSWDWDFDDGFTSNEKNPLHVYQSAGEYYPTLIISNVFGADTAISTVPVIVYDTLSIDFTAFPTTGQPNLNVAFDPSYSHAPEQVIWYFGDGETSTDLSPNHLYKSVGLFDVKLVAQLCNYTDSLVKHDYIVVTQGKVCGDVNCDGRANVSDAVYIINYVFGVGTPVPCEDCP